MSYTGKYLESCARRGLRPRTIACYRERLSLFCEAHDPATATTAQIETWLDAHCHQPSSRQTYRSTLAGYYNWLEETGHIDRSPVRATARPRVKAGMPRPIAPADVATALLRANPTNRAMIGLMAYAGLRACEIAWLTVEDIDLDRHRLVLRQTKGGAGRVLPLHPKLEVILRPVLPRRGPVFGGLQPYNVAQRVRNHLHRCGIAASGHQLRHTFGTLVWEISREHRVVQEMLGHASPATSRIYARFDVEHARPAVFAISF